MDEKKVKKVTEADKRKEEFLKTVESKLKKSEKDIWFVHDVEHVFDKRK
ncbi:MAG: hypothetical protein JXO44_14780 [Clostridia bacterium]|nr:hypothetical protein [Clostridia bacterium]